MHILRRPACCANRVIQKRLSLIDLVKELGRRISAVKKEARATIWLRQRISLAIQRGNSFSVLATHRVATSEAIIA